MRMATCHPDREHEGHNLCSKCLGKAYYASHREKYKAYHFRHKEEHNAYNATYYAEHKQERKVYRATYYANHKEWDKAYHAAHREKRLAYATAYQSALKLAALNAYGGPRCACCGETLIRGLTLDHIHGDGAAHRREAARGTGGTSPYRWVKKNNYPLGFQVLCGTCNIAKGTGDHCPHQKDWRKGYYAGHRDKARTYSATWQAALKLAAFNAYGGTRCVCCGETLIEGLTIDHMNGNGVNRRRGNKGIASGTSLYLWLKQNNYPPGFQVLCGTCNMAKGTGDHCPHQDEAKSGPS